MGLFDFLKRKSEADAGFTSATAFTYETFDENDATDCGFGDIPLLTLKKDGSVTLRYYTEKECRSIFTERNSYVLEQVHSYGEDYGGSQYEDERETTYEEIIDERILVKDGHFCGVSIIAEYNNFNGPGSSTIKEAKLLTDGSGTSSVRSGFFFSNDDHSRWNYSDYRLVKRPDDY